MRTVYISIHLGSCVILLQAEDVQMMCMHCYSKATMAAQLLICILLVCGDIMWHSGFGDLLSCPRGRAIETKSVSVTFC